MSVCGTDSWLCLPPLLAPLGLRVPLKGKGELLLVSRRDLHKPSPLEPLLEMKVGGLLSPPLRVLDALQRHPS
jgi:hypothetical protein